MALPSLPVIRALGLWSHPNPLSLPQGALVVADECVLDKEGTIEKRRGFSRYGAALSGPASAISEYLGRLLVLDGASLKYDSDGLGTWSAWSGSFSPPSGARMGFLESNGNVYFLTSKGVYYNDSLTGTPRRAGVPQGLDAQLSKVGTGGSWFEEESVVGYRHLWKHKDANGNAKPGAPSHQERIANAKTTGLAWSRSGSTVTITHTAHGFSNGDTIEIDDTTDAAALPDGSKTISNVTANTYDVTGLAGGATSGTCSDGKRFNVQVSFTIPAGVLEGDTWELYRTDLTATASDSPGGDHRLIASGKASAADLGAGVITVIDSRSPSFLKENLYTNSTSEGDAQAAHRPPLCDFVAQFEGHTFYGGNISREHFLEVQLLDVAGLVDDTSSITITLGATARTYTFSTAENQGALKFKRFTSELTLVQNIEKTAKSLQKIINRDPSSLVYAHYVSGEDDAPGRLLLETKELGTAAFTAIANNGTTGGKFSPNLTTAATSENDFRANGIRRSKFQQPEAVPRQNDNHTGRSNSPIVGMVALLEAMLIWKRDDGIFKLSGKTDRGGGFAFLLDDLDPTIRLEAPNTLVLLNNAAIGFTSQGVLRASQGPPLVLSRPQVETELKQIATFDNFAAIAHAIAYESDRKYILFHPLDSGDTICRVASVYDYSAAGGGGWTKWKKQVAAGHVLKSDDKLYLAHAVDAYILQERKSLNPFTGDDYVDEDIGAEITATATTTHPFLTADLTEFGAARTVSLITVTYNYSEYPRKGFLLQQGASRDLIDAVEDLGGGSFRFTMRNLTTGFANGAATVGLAIRMQIEWAPITGENPFLLKHLPFAAIYLRRQGGTHRLGFQSDAQDFRSYTRDIVFSKTKGWGLKPWGSFPWGDSSPAERRKIRSFIPLNHQKSTALSVTYEAHYARHGPEVLGLGLEGREIGPRSEKRPA